MREQADRPIAITILALLFLLVSGTGILSLVTIVFSGTTSVIWHWLTANDIHSLTWSNQGSHLFFTSWFCAYVLNAALGYGLWNLRNWARKGAGIAQIVSIPPGVFLAVMLYLRIQSIWVMVVAFAILAVMVLVFWYLNRPQTRAVFEAEPWKGQLTDQRSEQLENRFF